MAVRTTNPGEPAGVPEAMPATVPPDPTLVLAVIAALALVGLAVASFRRVPAGRYAFVERLGRRRLHGPGYAVIVPRLDRVVWVDDTAKEAVVVPFLPTVDGIVVGPSAVAWVAVDDPARAAERVMDPLLVAREVVETELTRWAGDRTLAELTALVERDVPAVANRATATTAELGVRVTRVRLEQVELGAA